jgi:hypothetical protein
LGATGPATATSADTSAAGDGDEQAASPQARATVTGAQITDHPFTFMHVSLQV